jgi:type IV pilus assembly protein PilE
MKSMHRKSAGFTLVELVVAMVIAAILAAIAIPAYSSYVL